MKKDARGRKLVTIDFSVELYETGPAVINVYRPVKNTRRISPPVELLSVLEAYARRCFAPRLKLLQAAGADAAGFGQLADELRRQDVAEPTALEVACPAEATGFIVDCDGCPKHRWKED